MSNTRKVTKDMDRAIQGPVSKFIEENYLHFNALTTKNAAKELKKHLDRGNKLLVTLAGAFSTGEGGKLLSELIREDKVHAISCTGANLEESIFNLVAKSKYKIIPNYLDLSPQDNVELMKQNYNRVTDTCIVEEEAFDKIADKLYKIWEHIQENNEEGILWHRAFYSLFENKMLTEKDFDDSIENCWVYWAWKKKLPIFVPGFEDSTMGNCFASCVYREEIEDWVILNGARYFTYAVEWYLDLTQKQKKEVAMVTLGGGIAADFIQCLLPTLKKDLLIENVPFWTGIVQITEATVGGGGFSGCQLNEKITWAKVSIDSFKYDIRTCYTVTFPIIAAYLLNK